MTLVRKAIVFSIAPLVAGAALIASEVMFARGTVKLTDYPQEQIDGTFGFGTARALNVVWLGDSTGRGIGATDIAHVLPVVVVRGLARPTRLTVLAVSGARAADVVQTQLPELKSIHADWVFVCVGGNDVTHLTSRRAFRESVAMLLSAVNELRPERVVVVGVGQFASTPLFAQPLRFIAGIRGAEIDADLRHAAKRSGALYVSIVERAGAEFVRDPARYHASDRFHPSDDGYSLWAHAILDAIKEAKW